MGLGIAGACLAAPEQVARVTAGELKEARASWWGFDKADSTRALQAAINSRVPRLVVDNAGAPWITDKLTCVSDQEILFEPGVEVLAKRGAFLGKHDSLFSLIGLTNVTLRGPGATLRMWRADYSAPPYAKAEWRHILDIKSSVNVKVYGLTLVESGGDGIYLGCVSPERPSREIHIKDVVCDKNYRQGISVISAEDLVIENTVMRSTAGTPPAAGIDFEPNNGAERLKNCVMRGCVAENNQGDGYKFHLLPLTRTTEPISIRIENCRSIGNRHGVRIATGNSEAQAVSGSVSFVDCRIENSQRPGVGVSGNPAFGLALTFERCTIAGCAAGTNTVPDILLSNDSVGDEFPVGGLRLDRVTILSPLARPWLAWENKTVADPVTALTGTVTVEQAGTRQDLVLTPEWVKEKFPPRFPVRVPRVKSDLAKAHVVDGAEGVRDLSPLRLRGGNTYVFYAAAGSEVVLVGQCTQVEQYGAGTKPMQVRAPSGKAAGEFGLPRFGERGEIRFKAEEAGFYTLVVDAGLNAFALVAANVPVAIDATRKFLWLIESAGALYAAVPRGTGVFAFGAAGEGDGEAVKITAINPAGSAVWTKDNIIQMERFTSTAGQGAEGGVWQMKIERPGKEGFGNFYVEVLGVPGYLFPSRERYWEF